MDCVEIRLRRLARAKSLPSRTKARRTGVGNAGLFELLKLIYDRLHDFNEYMSSLFQIGRIYRDTKCQTP